MGRGTEAGKRALNQRQTEGASVVQICKHEAQGVMQNTGQHHSTGEDEKGARRRRIVFFCETAVWCLSDGEEGSLTAVGRVISSTTCHACRPVAHMANFSGRPPQVWDGWHPRNG